MPRSSLGRALATLVVIEVASLAIGLASFDARQGSRYALTAFFSLGVAAVVAVVLVYVTWQLIRAQSRPVRSLNARAQTASGDSATIEVRRPLNGGSDILRAYAVLIDGVEIVSLRLGERVRVTVEPGKHTMKASVAGEISPTTELDIDADQQADVDIVPTPGNTAQRRQTGWLMLRTSPI